MAPYGETRIWRIFLSVNYLRWEEIYGEILLFSISEGTYLKKFQFRVTRSVLCNFACCRICLHFFTISWKYVLRWRRKINYQYAIILTLFLTMNFHKQRTITHESMVRYIPLSNYTSTTTSKAWPSIYSMHLPLQSPLNAFGGSVEEGIIVLNNVTKFHKFWSKLINLESGHNFKWWIFINKWP